MRSCCGVARQKLRPEIELEGNWKGTSEAGVLLDSMKNEDTARACRGNRFPHRDTDEFIPKST